jgi:hypothetical protein
LLPARPSTPSVVSLRHDSGDVDSLASYWTFYWAVAAAQLGRWLPRRPARLLDISGLRARCAPQAAAAGHTVIELLARPPEDPPQAGIHPVVGDAASLGFLTDGCLDGVIAEDRVLSRHLVTEATVAEIARVLRPGGRVLLCVDSLMLGMAILAEQNCWAQLSDVPSAEVVLVPWPDGTITEAGLEVEWIRPRTTLSPSTVEHILTNDPRGLARLVRTEMSAPVGDESVGIHLIASARRPR